MIASSSNTSNSEPSREIANQGRRDEAQTLDLVPEETEASEQTSSAPSAVSFSTPPAASSSSNPPSRSSSRSSVFKSPALSAVETSAAKESVPPGAGGRSPQQKPQQQQQQQQQQNDLHHHHSLSESAHSAKSAIKSTFKKLHSSPSLAPQGAATPSGATTPTTSSSTKKTLSSSSVGGSPASPSSESNSPGGQLPKRAHTFSIHRRRTVGSHDAPAPSAQAQARKQAASSSNTETIQFSFGPGAGANKLGTTSDLSYASNISTYQSSQRPVPQPGSVLNRRTFSFSKLSTKLKSGSKESDSHFGRHSMTVTTNNANSGHRPTFSLSSGRHDTSDSTTTSGSQVSNTGREKVSPAAFLPTDLQVKNWALSTKYSSSKLPVVNKSSKVLGKGATATVKIVQAHCKLKDGTKQFFAAKVYNKCAPGENLHSHYSKLADEYIITSRLRHRNIVRIHDLCLDNGDSWCAVMDFCDGGDLFSLMDSYKTAHRKIPKEERNCLFKQLLMGVNYIHGQGVAHRDIKPENLLINSKGELKISDFGVSVIVFDVSKNETSKDARMTSGFAGSIPYLPPEVFESKKDPTQKYDARLVDIWSCACTYINLVIGGGFFSKASLEDDPAYVRFMREMDRYWQHEKGVNDFLIGEGETKIQDDSIQAIVDNAAATAKIVKKANELAAAQEEAEDAEANSPPEETVSRTSTSTSTTTQSSTEGSTSTECSSGNSQKFTRSYIMNMTEEQQPLFFFNEFGEAGKRLLAQMLIPDPALRPQITDIMRTSIIRRLGTCVGDESVPLGVSLPASATDFKKFKDENSHILKHTHKAPTKGPSLLGLGFKDPYKDMY